MSRGLRRVVVFGGSAPLGSAIVKGFVAPGARVFSPAPDEVDMMDLDTVADYLSRRAPGYVVNCAEYTDIDGEDRDMEIAYAINEEGAGNISLVSRGCGAHFLQVSTNLVFDGRSQVPYRPGDKTNPVGLYGVSKLAGERLVMNMNPIACILRVEREIVSSCASAIAVVVREILDRRLSGIFHYSPPGRRADFAPLDGSGLARVLEGK